MTEEVPPPLTVVRIPCIAFWPAESAGWGLRLSAAGRVATGRPGVSGAGSISTEADLIVEVPPKLGAVARGRGLAACRSTSGGTALALVGSAGIMPAELGEATCPIEPTCTSVSRRRTSTQQGGFSAGDQRHRQDPLRSTKEERSDQGDSQLSPWLAAAPAPAFTGQLFGLGLLLLLCCRCR